MTTKKTLKNSCLPKRNLSRHFEGCLYAICLPPSQLLFHSPLCPFVCSPGRNAMEIFSLKRIKIRRVSGQASELLSTACPFALYLARHPMGSQAEFAHFRWLAHDHPAEKRRGREENNEFPRRLAFSAGHAVRPLCEPVVVCPLRAGEGWREWADSRFCCLCFPFPAARQPAAWTRLAPIFSAAGRSPWKASMDMAESKTS